MDAYLAKPLGARELQAVIAGLDRRVPTSQGSRAPDLDRGPLDERLLLERVGGDRRALTKLVRLFLSDARELLARARRAVELRDAPGLRAAAHALKGSVSNFAAPTARAAAARLQEIGESEDLSQASVAYARLDEELASVRESLKALVSRGAGARARRAGSTRRPSRGRPSLRRKRRRR
jgi:HPt (histidine-containing phosphotransfer) domain-containing protein